MKENFEKLQEFVNEMKNNSSLIVKKNIIKNYENSPFIQKALVYAYDPYKKYYITSKTCKKNFNLRDSNYIHDSIFDLFHDTLKIFINIFIHQTYLTIQYKIS